MTDTITLSGAECLVFFLGGPPGLITEQRPPTREGCRWGSRRIRPIRSAVSARPTGSSFTEFDAKRLLCATSPPGRNTR